MYSENRIKNYRAYENQWVNKERSDLYELVLLIETITELKK